MHLANFWLQIHKLPPSFFTETVGRGLGNFVGTFVRYDAERNVYRSSSSYLRVRVKLDTTKPLPRGKKIGPPGKPSFMCEFRSSRQRHWPYKKNGNDVDRHTSDPVMKRWPRWSATLRVHQSCSRVS
ncbi:hypothetical protein LINGRAHAP2_LOCUS30441, partial [Linum grandiflorum]